jgi:hypothetical protein
MIVILVLLGIAAVVGIVGAVVDLRRDGYRRLPDRAEGATWAARSERDPLR